MATDTNLSENEKKILDEIIYPDIEPGIINRAMIEAAYMEEGLHGEELRLHQMEPIVLDRIKTMRLEFKKILRIDHLWILPNLTKLVLCQNKIEVIENIEMLTSLVELNLSFNYIEKIQNLEALVNLEVLSLFCNKITKLENLETLSKLVILSVGDNQIDSIEGIESFRFFNDLRVLNLEGNPIAKKTDFLLSEYIIAILPQLNYYEYVYIKNDVRESAKKKYYREIRDISDRQEKEIEARATHSREEAEAERLSSSFVEHLNGNQLYLSLWRGDEDGRVLLLVGAQAQEVVEEYEKDVFEITQEIYKLGLERFGERDAEIKDFMENLKEGQEELQALGQKEIETFLEYKESVFDEARSKLRQLETNIIQGDDEDSAVNLVLSDAVDKLTLEFEDALNVLWQTLMTQELHLHEAVEESTTNFQRKVTELMAKFVEQAQAHFVQLREVALHFSESMAEILTRFIGTKLALQDFTDVAPELHICLEDRDAIVNLVAGMKESHTYRIDEREDRMTTRSRDFIESMVEKLNNEEVERHRAKILEINSFVEIMGESMTSLPNEIREQMHDEDYA